MRNHAIKLPTDRNQILSYLFHEIFFFYPQLILVD